MIYYKVNLINIDIEFKFNILDEEKFVEKYKNFIKIIFKY